MTLDKWFDGDVALVTGGSSGIGRATALAFSSLGAKVLVASRRSEEAAEIVKLIEAAGGSAIFVKTDVSNADEVKEMVFQAVKQFGSLTYAFNNAGIEGDAFIPTADYLESTWDEVIDINLKGVFLCMKYEIPHILETKGAIVNMASIAGLCGGRLGAAYYASKHGVVGLTKVAALEYAENGIRVNAVAPAIIKTPLAGRAFFHNAELTTRLTKLHPIGRLGSPEEVASAVTWLCSKGASFITGHTLPVDGGFLIP